MDGLAQKIDAIMGTQEAKDVKTLVAFTIRRTKTLTDDEIVENIDDIVTKVADNISEVADMRPTADEAKDAVVRLLKSVAAETSTKWDDRVVNIIDIFV